MKRNLIYLLTLLSLFGFQSCQDGMAHLETGSSARDILIHLDMGRGGGSSTRAMTDAEEKEVKESTVTIYAFEKEGSEYIYSYRPQIKSISIKDKKLTMRCKTSDKVQLFLIVANAPDETAKVVPQPGETFDAISRQLTTELSTAWPAAHNGTKEFRHIPMSCIIEATISTGMTTLGTEGNPHYLVRMLAKLCMNLSATVIDEYTLEEVYLYRPGKAGYIVYNPDDAYWDVAGKHAVKAYAPAVDIPEDYTTDKYRYETGDTEKKALVNTIYAFETAATGERLKTTALVVGLLKKGDPDAEIQYYRIDIKKDGKNEDVPAFSADILRNFNYQITINTVNSDGKKDPDTAYLGELEYALDISINTWIEQEIPTEL